MAATVPLEALIAWSEEESRKWQEFFRANPQAYELRTDVAHSSTVRDLLVHIVAVDYLYTERIQGKSTTPWDQVAARAAADPFALGQAARAWFRKFLSDSDDAALDATMTFGTLTSGQFSATRRKMLVHTLMHGIRHWAQLATLMRQNGYPDPGKHDFLFSGGMK